MKNVFPLFLLSFLLFSCDATKQVKVDGTEVTIPKGETTETTGETPDYMNANEFAMIKEINLMRSNPSGYVRYVEQYLADFKADEGYDAATKQEEEKYAKSLIAELKKLAPLSQLSPHSGLYKVAQIHGKDVQGQGMIGHKGSDGSMPWDRVKKHTDLTDGNENLVGGNADARFSVINLLIDAGIPFYGHRKTLLQANWQYVSVYKIGEVGGVNDCWIQVFGR